MKQTTENTGNPGRNQDCNYGVADQVLTECMRVLNAWDKGAGLRDIMPRQTPTAAIVHKVIWELFRHRAVLDWQMQRFAQRKIRGRLRNILRWGICEIMYLQGLNPAVAVDACVRYLKKHRANSAETGFVNALLRRITVHSAAELQQAVSESAPPAVRLELGEELYEQWRRRFAEDELERLAGIVQLQAVIYVRCRKPLSAELSLPPGLKLPDAHNSCTAPGFLQVVNPEIFFASAESGRGDYYVQDPVTLNAVRLMAVQSGEKILDMCAAPGGKALLLAEAIGSSGMIAAADVNLQRLKVLKMNAGSLKRLVPIAADGTTAPFPADLFDAVLLDAPCSNTGVVGRRPDVRWRFSATNLAELCLLQKRLLQEAARVVRPGGRLVYSTCSIEPEENKLQLDRFIEEHPHFKLAETRQTMPEPGHDGAFAALLLKKMR